VSPLAAKVMRRFYRRAKGCPDRLPWHRESPNPMLVSAVMKSEQRGRALDVGCGAGVFSVWMAEHGMDVTGIDSFPEAIAMARECAAANGADVAFITADLFTYTPQRPFDLVFDSGCLHSLVGGSVAAYRDKVIDWLAPGGEFVLEHWGKRHALDWRPVGPRRRSPAAIRQLFSPLEHIGTHEQDISAPLPFGPTVRAIAYRFRQPDRR
jgi:cyclopropane fatty-acyl-phospholipid synthase-like methyltransferase